MSDDADGMQAPEFSEDPKIVYELLCIEALTLKISGMTYEDIAGHQGCSGSTAFRRCAHALDGMRPHADYDQYRARQLAELEPARQLANKTIADADKDLAPRFKAVERLIQIQDRESKLLALDKAPTPMEEAARKLAAASPEEISAEMNQRAGQDAG